MYGALNCEVEIDKLLLQTIPEALANMPGAQFFAVMFFVMVIGLIAVPFVIALAMFTLNTGTESINRLRERTKQALGPAYDFKGFNDAVVTGGGVPMTVLEANIDRYIAAQKRGG